MQKIQRQAADFSQKFSVVTSKLCLDPLGNYNERKRRYYIFPIFRFIYTIYVIIKYNHYRKGMIFLDF